MQVECHDIAACFRKTLNNMNMGRSNFNPLIRGDYIYVFGGRKSCDEMNECERFVYKFDMASVWQDFELVIHLNMENYAFR